MTKYLFEVLFMILINGFPLNAQQKTDAWLKNLLQKHASPELQHILEQPDSFRYQIIYTRIDRNKKNIPKFTYYYYNVNRNEYFNPASSVKMPLAFLALEKINQLQKYGVHKFTPMLTDSAFSRQTTVSQDSTSQTGLPSVGHYIKKIFLVSDNDAYSRLYEFIGQQTINERLWEMGYKDMRITRRFVPMNEEENRHTNPIRFLQNGKILYEQSAAYSTIPFDFSRKILIGKGHYDREEKLVKAPMDFTMHNNAPLEDLQQILQSVLFPASVEKKKRYNLSENDLKFLYRCMSQLPSESKYPKYDTAEYFDSYTKFFLFKAGKSPLPSYIRVFNKTGWSYGFLTDVAYIVDFRNKVEFMLSGVIYVNSDGILNDNKYEYGQVGYPFFKEVGNIIYNYELERHRKYVPDLGIFQLSYDE